MLYDAGVARPRVQRRRPRPSRSAAARLALAEQLYRDFVALTPYPRPAPFVKSFESYDEYDAWRHAQRNPWLR